MSSGTTSIYPQGNLNSSNSFSAKIYVFDRFRLDVAHRMLYEEGTPVALAPKVIETLIALVEKSGELLSKEELMGRVWSGATVEESNLTQNIYLLRKALGNRASGEPLVESFRRRGYRFNGEARQAAAPIVAAETINGKAANNFQAATAAAVATLPSPKAYGRKRLIYFAIGALATCVLLIAVVFIVNRSLKAKTPNSSAATLKITRLTPDLNVFGAAAFTPDGDHLAYVLSEKANRSVWLKDMATGSATRILPPAELGYGYPTFSSDGQTLYYVARQYLAGHKDTPNGAIVRRPMAGGGEQKIAVDVISPFALSPDEKQLAFLNSKWQLLVAQTDGSGQRLLAERDRKKAWFETWASVLSWSPDGKRIAVCGGEPDERGKRKAELLEVSVHNGSIKLIPIPDWDYVDDVIWLRDQTGLLVVARETATAPFQIWKVAYPSGAATRVTNDTNSYDDISLSADSRRLVARQVFHNTNIWTVPVDAPGQAKQLTFGSAALDGVRGVAFAPDGKIIYTSPRDGNLDLWEINLDGSQQRQLTKNNGWFNGYPNITRDGRYVVFASERSGKNQIWRMDADGANPQQLTDADIGATEPALSPDGAWVYFTINEGIGAASIWKAPIGGGAMIRVSPITQAWSSAWAPAISPDGKLIGFTLYDDRAVQPWKTGVMRAKDGATLRIFDIMSNRGVLHWAADGNALIFINVGSTDLWRLPIDGGPPRRLTNFGSGSISNFALSPDRKRFALARGNPSAEVVLVENF